LSRNAAGQILAGIFALGLPGLALAAECANGSHITSSTSCTVPAGTLVTVEAWGAGGGGGGGVGTGAGPTRYSGGGGGGGSYCKATFTSGGSVLSLTIAVGASGTGATSPAGGPVTAGTAGGDSTVVGLGSIDLLAAGGAGGAVNAAAGAAGGGAGGAACTGVTTGTWVAGFAGGAGGHASEATGFGPGGSGGGGAAASDTLAGNDGSAGDAGSSGGINSEGGAGDMPGNDRGGGNGARDEGGPSNVDAKPGVSPGGGGGGGMYSNLVEANRLGAAGAGGAVRLTWTPVPVGAAPAATTGAASSISATGATLNGMVNDNGADTAVSFDYGADTSYGTNVAATTGAMVLTGSGSTAAAKTLAGLACNSNYHFRVVGSNSAGTTNGSDAPFTTSACTTGPGVTTNAATSVGQTGATLNASVSDVGANVSGIAFEYGTTTGYGTTRAASTTSITASAGAPSSIAPTAALTGLSCGTTYHFRIQATDANATNHGSDATFTTTACSSSGDSGGSTGTVISGGSGTLGGGSTAIVTGPSNLNVSGGSSTIDASSGGASGSTINLGSGSSTSVILGSGGQQVTVTSASGGATLGVVGGSTGSGSPNALVMSSGSAAISGISGSSLVAVGSGGSTQVIAGSGGSSITATAGSGVLKISVNSGSVTAPRNCGTAPTAPSLPPENSSNSVWQAYYTSLTSYRVAKLNYLLCTPLRMVRAAADVQPTTSASVLYQGETITYNSAGHETGVTLADGGAGAPQVLDARPRGISLESVPVSIDGMPARLKGANLGSAIVTGMARLVGAPLTRLSPNTPVGGVAMATADGTQLTAVPVGPLRVARSASDGLLADGLVRIVVDGVVADFAPSLASAGNFASQLTGLDSQASVAIAANGLVKATAGGARFMLWPAWAASPSTLKGFSFDRAGRLVFGDGRMQQTLYPAFANVDALAVALGAITGSTDLEMALDGTIAVRFGGTVYRLRAGYQLVDTPKARANDHWWLEGGSFYVNNHDGSAQSFTVE
jgi:hypothetical protein